jgi:hypothetical protein
MRVLLLASLLLCMAMPAGASPEPPLSGCAAVQPLPVTFQGMIEAAGPARWQVAGQTVEIGAASAILPAGPPPATGSWASVAALWRLDGSLVATRIETSPAPPPVEPLAQFIGLVEAIGPAEWIVGGVQLTLTPETILVGQAAVGSVALVAARQSGIAWYALLLAAAPPGVDPLFLDGTLLAVDGDLWVVQASGASLTVDVSGDVFVQGAPAAGRRVQVMAVAQAGQPAQALYAAVMPQDDERVYFGGRLVAQIVSTAPEQWLLLTPSDDGPWLELRTVTVDRLAIPIDETAGPAVPGAWLEAAAVAPLWPGQPWAARSLRVDFGPQATVQGSIDEIGEGMPARWQVGDTCVVIDGDVAVDGRPRAGRYAIAQGTQLGSTVLWARSAAVRYRFQGTLVARLAQMTPPLWVILVAAPAHVDASGQTRVYLALDAASRIDPSLHMGVLGVEVAVQARAGQSGWLADWVDDPASPWQP